MNENKRINEVIKLYKANNLKKAKKEINRLLEKDFLRILTKAKQKQLMQPCYR